MIADWAHDRLFLPTTQSDWELVYDKEVSIFLETLSAYYDALDRHRSPNPPPPFPEALRHHAKSLGIAGDL
jgi:hypothetical protein